MELRNCGVRLEDDISKCEFKQTHKQATNCYNAHFLQWRNMPHWTRPSSLSRILDHTQTNRT
jgi:hypothetical protein